MGWEKRLTVRLMVSSRLRFFPLFSYGCPFCSPALAAGLTYAAIGALTFLSRTPGYNVNPPILTPGTIEFESLVNWLVSRQTSDLDDEDVGDEDLDERHSGPGETQSSQVDVENVPLEDGLASLPFIPPQSPESIQWAGFNGRCNKIADTCYSFWTSATLVVRVS